MRTIQKIRIVLGALGISITALASTVLAAAATAPPAVSELEARSAEELARYLASGGGNVVC